MPAEYDDRSHARYEEIQESLGLRLAGRAILLGIFLIFVVLYLPFRGLDLSKPRDVALIAVLVFLGGVTVLLFLTVGWPTYYTIGSGLLTYPRLGGRVQGSIPLSRLDSFRREGRDPSNATIRVFSSGRIRLSIPEWDLAAPAGFRNALLSSGVKELPPRFLRPES